MGPTPKNPSSRGTKESNATDFSRGQGKVKKSNTLVGRVGQSRVNMYTGTELIDRLISFAQLAAGSVLLLSFDDTKV